MEASAEWKAQIVADVILCRIGTARGAPAPGSSSTNFTKPSSLSVIKSPPSPRNFVSQSSSNIPAQKSITTPSSVTVVTATEPAPSLSAFPNLEVVPQPDVDMQDHGAYDEGPPCAISCRTIRDCFNDVRTEERNEESQNLKEQLNSLSATLERQQKNIPLAHDENDALRRTISDLRESAPIVEELRSKLAQAHQNECKAKIMMETKATKLLERLLETKQTALREQQDLSDELDAKQTLVTFHQSRCDETLERIRELEELSTQNDLLIPDHTNEQQNAEVATLKSQLHQLTGELRELGAERKQALTAILHLEHKNAILETRNATLEGELKEAMIRLDQLQSQYNQNSAKMGRALDKAHAQNAHYTKLRRSILMKEVLTMQVNEDKLREPQIQALRKLRDFTQAGGKRGLIVLPTGVGKTLLAILIVLYAQYDRDLPVVYCSARVDLLHELHKGFTGRKLQANTSTTGHPFNSSLFATYNLLPDLPLDRKDLFNKPIVVQEVGSNRSQTPVWNREHGPAVAFLTVQNVDETYQTLESGKTPKVRRIQSMASENIAKPGLIIMDEPQLNTTKLSSLSKRLPEATIIAVTATPPHRLTSQTDGFSLIYDYPMIQAIQKGLIKNCIWLTVDVFAENRYGTRKFPNQQSLESIAKRSPLLRKKYQEHPEFMKTFAKAIVATLAQIRDHAKLAEAPSQLPFGQRHPGNPDISGTSKSETPAAIVKCQSHQELRRYECVFRSLPADSPVRVLVMGEKNEPQQIRQSYEAGDYDVLLIVNKLSCGFHASKTHLVAITYTPKSATSIAQLIGRAVSKGSHGLDYCYFMALGPAALEGLWMEYKVTSHVGTIRARELFHNVGMNATEEEKGIWESAMVAGHEDVSEMRNKDDKEMDLVIGDIRGYRVLERDQLWVGEQDSRQHIRVESGICDVFERVRSVHVNAKRTPSGCRMINDTEDSEEGNRESITSEESDEADQPWDDDDYNEGSNELYMAEPRRSVRQRGVVRYLEMTDDSEDEEATSDCSTSESYDDGNSDGADDASEGPDDMELEEDGILAQQSKPTYGDGDPSKHPNPHCRLQLSNTSAKAKMWMRKLGVDEFPEGYLMGLLTNMQGDRVDAYLYGHPRCETL
ncbi:hypothetical protein HDV00_006344 [Rhizophlyctis rosea]|nr:hypothetical protein HDV00_006344 [Rhizophlyctis rosea]